MTGRNLNFTRTPDVHLLSDALRVTKSIRFYRGAFFFLGWSRIIHGFACSWISLDNYLTTSLLLAHYICVLPFFFKLER